jgi:hypothetical protein
MLLACLSLFWLLALFHLISPQRGGDLKWLFPAVLLGFSVLAIGIFAYEARRAKRLLIELIEAKPESSHCDDIDA